MRVEGLRIIFIIEGGGLLLPSVVDYDGLYEDGEGAARSRFYLVRMQGRGKAGCIVAAEYEVAVVVSWFWDLSGNANVIR